MRPPHIALASSALLVGLLWAPALAQNLSFADATQDLGIDADFFPDFADPVAKMRGGAAVADFNQDGWPDIFVLCGGARNDILYINNGDGTFTDRAQEWGVAYAHYGCSVTVADYDSDGDPDMYIASVGEADLQADIGKHLLYRNNGDGTFTDVAAEAGVQTVGVMPSGMGAVFGDYDLDGDLDLFTTSWFVGARGNRLYRNNGDGTFTDNTGIIQGGDLDSIYGFTPAFADMNNDGYPEILIAGDFSTSAYFINEGGARFQHVSREDSGIDADCNAMGAVVADFNQDGWLDWSISNILHETAGGGVYDGCGQTLYTNLGGSHAFVDTAPEAGVHDGHWGWGVDAVDFDNDGLLDMAQTNGWSAPFDADPTLLWMNRGDGTFLERGTRLGFDDRSQGRGLITLDYDQDGDMDIAVINNVGVFKLFRNDLIGDAANFIRIELDTSNRPDLAPDGFGARIQLQASGVTQHRYIDGAPTYLSVSSLTEHFGLGEQEKIDRVKVIWPDAGVTVMQSLEAGFVYEIMAPPTCRFPDIDGDAVPDWGQFDPAEDGVTDLEDLYAAREVDVNDDGVIDVADGACMQAFLRVGERLDALVASR